MSPLDGLSARQRDAVRRTGQDVCVVAGPGSGKTRVLIERFAWLVEHEGVDPARILAITFTEKAATEIKERLIRRFADPSLLGPDRREELERAWVSTIDGLCFRLLQEHAIAAGLAPDFAVLDAAAADHMLRLAAEDALDALYRERPEEVRRLLRALDLSTQDDLRQPDLAECLIQVYQAMRMAGAAELPGPRREPALFEEARELASAILRDPTPGGTANARQEIARLNELAATFRVLPGAAAGIEHLDAAGKLASISRSLVRIGSRQEPLRRLKDELLPELQAAWIGQYYGDLHELLRAGVGRISSAYAEAKRAENAVDFADLEALAIGLLESDAEIREAVRSRFDHTLMDELQDTNPLQWRLVGLIRTSFFGVGDLNQSIYGFRHAEPELFETYRASIVEAAGVIDTLDDNYRSRPEILDAVERALHGAPGIEPRKLSAQRKFAPAPGPGPLVERLIGQGENPTESEAKLVAGRIRAMLDTKERQPGEIAVLVRTLAALAPVERALDLYGVPFLVSGGRTFLEARETRDLMLLLAALANPLDEIAMVGVLRGPLCGLSDREILIAGEEGRQQAFEERFGDLRRLAGFVPPDVILARVLDRSRYYDALTVRARANVEKFLGWVRREHRRRPRPLPELLEKLEASRAQQNEAEAPPPEATEAVRVMTMHAAKGLEFPVVFVVALHWSPPASHPVVLFSAEHGLGAKWRNPATGKAQSDAVHRVLVEDRKRREEAEQNRLLYVAMTRAEDRLYLSYAEKKYASAWRRLVEGAVGESTGAATGSAEAPEIVSSTNRPIDNRPQVGNLPHMARGDGSASVTDVALFAACPRKYYLARYLGLEAQSDGPGTGAMQIGVAVHQALSEKTAGKQVDSAEAEELAERFRASDLYRRALRANRVEREFDFMLAVDDLILTGQIDLWFEEGGELVLVDYKTDRDDSSASAYALQLRLYALALRRYAGRLPERAVLYYLRADKALEISIGEGECEDAAQVVTALKDAQERGVFPLNVGVQCSRCEFRGRECPQGSGTSAAAAR